MDIVDPGIDAFLARLAGSPDPVEAEMRPATAEKRVVQRAQALLLMADGVSPYEVAKLLGVHSRTAWEWKARFVHCDDPVSKLVDAPRSGRPPSLSQTPTRPESRAKRVGLLVT